MLIVPKSIQLAQQKIYYLDQLNQIPLDQLAEFPINKARMGIKSIKSQKKIREYLLTRALLNKSFNIQNLDYDADGVPIWPSTLLGSITHNNDYLAVATANKDEAWGLGIDVESISRVKVQLKDKILTPGEQNYLLNNFPSKEFQKLLCLIFSAKEALFKAHYPFGRIRFYFLDAEVINIDLENKILSIQVHLETSKNSQKLHKSICYWTELEDRHILTMIKERHHVN